MHGLQLPSPLQELKLNNNKGVHFYVKRDDLIHQDISGNKWRKLKYQIQDAIDHKHDGIITFGGAFSNHIVATAAACQLSGLESVGIIRGERSSIDNPSLRKASRYGMTLHFVNRSDYKIKENSKRINAVISQYSNYQLIPEGGSHQDGLLGVEEIIKEINVQSKLVFNYACCAVGTGTTFAGLANSFGGELIGVNVLKNVSVVNDICQLLKKSTLEKKHKIIHDYHFGGYAKFTPELIKFMHKLYQNHAVKTDVIYTSKLFFAAMDLLTSNYFKANSHVMIYHSGGLQGNEGMNYRFPGLINFH